MRRKRRCDVEEVVARLEELLYNLLEECECGGACGGEYTCADANAKRGAEEVVELLKELGCL